MAVIKCPECHREMSDVAEKCPNCGYPYAEKIAIYHQAKKLMMSCETENSFRGLAELFRSISGIYDSDEQAQVCLEKAEAYRIQDLQREEERIKREEEQAKQREIQSKQNRKSLKKCGIAALLIIVVTSIGLAVPNIIDRIHAPKLTSFDSAEEMEEILQGNWQTTYYDLEGNEKHRQLSIAGSTAKDNWDNCPITSIKFYPEIGQFFASNTKWECYHYYTVFTWEDELIIIETQDTSYNNVRDKEKWFHYY